MVDVRNFHSIHSICAQWLSGGSNEIRNSCPCGLSNFIFAPMVSAAYCVTEQLIVLARDQLIGYRAGELMCHFD